MEASQYLAGIYFADNVVTWGVALVVDPMMQYPEMDFNFESGLDLPDLFFEQSFPASLDPNIDLPKAIRAIDNAVGLKSVVAITSATIGPFKNRFRGESIDDVRPKNEGTVIDNPRLELWGGADLHSIILRTFQENKGLSPIIKCLTDAEACALGEHFLFRKEQRSVATDPAHGHHEIGQDTVVYLLFDGGVGGAVLKDGKFLRGDTNLEIGHMPIYGHPNDKAIQSCGAHQYPCLEGTVSLKAIKERWGKDEQALERLNKNSAEFEFLAFYLAQAIWNITLFFAPTVNILGGRVIKNEELLKLVRHYFSELSQNRRDTGNDSLYPHYHEGYKPNEFIQPWSHSYAGILGCLCWSYKSVNT